MTIDMGKTDEQSFTDAKAQFKGKLIWLISIAVDDRKDKLKDIEIYIQDKLKLNKNIKNVLLDMVDYMDLSTSISSECYLYFTDKKQENLARLITYGNREVEGNYILLDVFTTLKGVLGWL